MQNNITKIEIAIDTNDNIQEDFLNYFNNPTDYNYHYSPTTLDNLRIAGEMYRDGTQNISLYPSIAKNKQLKIYNKTLELKYNSNKGYISDYHVPNGLDVNKTITRVELTLLNSAFKCNEHTFSRGSNKISSYEYKNLNDIDKIGYVEDEPKQDYTLNYKDLRNKTLLLETFNKYTNGFKAFSVKSGKARKTRCKTVQLLDFTGVGEPTPIIYTTVKKEYKIHMTATYKTLIREYYRTNIKQFLETAELLAKQTGTHDEYIKQLRALEPMKVLYQNNNVTPRNSLSF